MTKTTTKKPRVPKSEPQNGAPASPAIEPPTAETATKKHEETATERRQRERDEHRDGPGYLDLNPEDEDAVLVRAVRYRLLEFLEKQPDLGSPTMDVFSDGSVEFDVPVDIPGWFPPEVKRPIYPTVKITIERGNC